jgi:putative tricarboxylic transport membrane protein
MNKDLISGIMMLVIGLSLMFVLIPLGIETPKKVRYAALSPNYYPYIISFLLTAIGMAVIFKSRKKSFTETNSQTHPKAFQRIFLFILLLVFYASSLNVLGFVAASIIGLIGSLYLAGERRALTIFYVSVAMPIVLYFFFYKVANIPIPLGITAPLFEGM